MPRNSHQAVQHVNKVITTRRAWLLWAAAVAFFLALALYPVSFRVTRAVSVALLFAIWFGLIALNWRRKSVRWMFVAATVICVGFLLLPSRDRPESAALRHEYVNGLLRYEGVSYFWGGESTRGIDCSGLVRRGLIDSLALRGVRTLDAGLVRQALSLWWHDCTASALGESHHALTVPLLETPSLNALDHSQFLPGDLAVTSSGVHIMAYLGDHRWIEADPDVHRVITVSPPCDNPWFGVPMKIVRWRLLQ